MQQIKEIKEKNRAKLLTINIDIEEVINIPTLNDRFNDAVKQGYLNKILEEVIIQSKVEFNYEDNEDEE